MESASHFLERNPDNFRGSYFLAACNPEFIDIGAQMHIRKLATLLEGPSTIADRTPEGYTCLHCCLCLDGKEVLPREWHDCMVYLVRQGADVNAKDIRGVSVSEFAYRPSHLSERVSSCLGDLWDAVLDTCNYDISEFRIGFPRRARYTVDYTRGDFEALWKGRERRCPYWDDADWSSPYDTPRERALDDVVCPDCLLVFWRIDTNSIDTNDTDEAAYAAYFSGEQGENGCGNDDDDSDDDEPGVGSLVQSPASENSFESLVYGKHQEDQHGNFCSAWSPLALANTNDSERLPFAPSTLASAVTSLQYEGLIPNPWLDHGHGEIEDLEDDEMEFANDLEAR